MRRTTRARRHETPAERSSIPSNAGLTRTGSCPPLSASAARTTPGRRTSPGWPGSARSNGGHVGVTRCSRSRTGNPGARVGAPRTNASRHASGVLSPAEGVPSVSTAPGSARRAGDVRPPIRRASWGDPSAPIYLGSHVAVTTDASTGLEASTGCKILPFGVLRREDFGVPRRDSRYRLSATDDNLGNFARLDRDRGADGHSAQRHLHAIQTLSQLSYSPTVLCSIRAPECANGSLARQQRPSRRSGVWPQRLDRR